MNAPRATAHATAQLVAVDHDPFADAPLTRVVPTTEPQREVWLACQLGTEASLAYNESVSLHLRGPLDVPALCAAMQDLVARHDALRATISANGQELLIAESLWIDIGLADFAALATADPVQAVQDAKRRAVELPFDLEKGPLVRASLLKLGDDDQLLLFTAHHIICDGWSFGVIVSDLGGLYAQRLGRSDSTLPRATSFIDYAIEQIERASTLEHEADEAYWLGCFDGSVPVLDLPTDRPRKPQRGVASRREDVCFDAEWVLLARRFGAQRGASLFATLLACLAASLHRVSGAEDLVIGIPSAGQSTPGFGAVVGHCVNLLPLRLAVDAAAGLPALVASTQSVMLDAFEHQQYTFGTLLKRMVLKRDPSRTLLVSVMFNLDPSLDVNAAGFPDLDVAFTGNPRSFENFELFFNAVPDRGGLRLECQYSTDLFDARTVRRWLGFVGALLRGAGDSPDTPLRLLPLVSPADRQLLGHWNDTAAPFRHAGLVHTLVEEQARRVPHRVAVQHGGRSLSYGELDGRANRIAHALRAKGVRRGALIGLHLERDADMLAAMLGVLKAGGAYVPLDPSYPVDRLTYMAHDARLSSLITHSALASVLGWSRDQSLWLDGDNAALQAQPAEPLPDDEHSAHAEGPAYVIYTSGSTGKPKGVRVPHRAVVNFLETMARVPGLTEDDCLVAVTTLSFDIAVTELLLPLTVGAQIVLARREEAADGALLRGLLETSHASVMQATPATWHLLIDAGWSGCAGFKVLCGGEPLSLGLAQRLTERGAALWNMYGPTETTVWSTCCRVEPGAASISIGRPIANTTVWILDDALQLCPIGVPGEICIGGAGVTLGYLNCPELTAERYIADPFSAAQANVASPLCLAPGGGNIEDISWGDSPGALLYRTGDRGRWLDEGRLEHLGRNDFQVKVRGYRIELGEIEAVLLAHPDMARAVVTTREDQPGDVRLIAYLVLAPGAGIDRSALQARLRQTLPDYMIPQHLVQLDAIVLLPNGKIDRKALPPPVPFPAATGEAVQLARTPMERQVLAAMEAVLNLPGLGVRDDFFSLGGHSLLAARLTVRLNKELGITLPLRAIFEAPTVEGLVRLAQLDRSGNAPPRSAIEHRADRREAPLTLMQERIRFMEEMYPGRVVYNTPSAHRLTGTLQRPAFEQALRRMMQRQPVLRTLIARGTQGPVQRVVDPFDFEFPFPFEDLSGVPEADREAELMRRMQAIIDQPIDIHVAPLFRVALFCLASDQHVFLFMPHHIIWDGWSFDLLYQELAALYPAALSQRPVSLAAPEVTYLDYAHWHARWLESDECRAQVQFWKRRYARVAELRALPTDRPRGAGMSGTGAVEWLHIDKEFTESLRAVARQCGATLNMLVMAVYAAMMSEALGTRSLVLGIPVRGRLNSEVESVMGFFNNLLPTPMAVDFNLSMRAWTGVVKRELLDSFAHQDVPFERIASEPEIAAHAGKTGLYQSLFSFQDARERERNWGSLTHQSVLVMQKGATEDFGFWLMEVSGGLEGGINYNSDLFDAATAQVFRERLVALLQRVATAPELSVAALLALPGEDTERFGAWVQARQPGPASSSSLPRSEYAASDLKSPSESLLASIWARLLGIDAAQISPLDNFFDIGGNSLLVMQAVAASETGVAPRTDPRRYVHETLQQLSGPVQSAKGADPEAAAVRHVPESSGLLSRVLGRFGRRS